MKISKISKHLATFALLAMSWIVMFLMAKDFGPYFGKQTTRTVMRSEVTFDRSPKNFVGGQILVTTDMKYLNRNCRSTLTISADNFLFSGDDFYDPAKRESLKQIQLNLFPKGNQINVMSNPILNCFESYKKPSEVRLITTGLIFILFSAISFLMLGRWYRFGLFLISLPIVSIALACI